MSSAEVPAELARSIGIMDALRSEGGDAWSAQQDHASLARYLLEESYEVLDVIEAMDAGPERDRALADELGDILFQVLFHARLGEESEPPWSLADVAAALNAKMERRNPHVFGPGAQGASHSEDIDQIVSAWHAAKAAEGRPTGLLDSVPERLPSLQRAAKAVHRARSRGELEELDRSAAASAQDVAGGDIALDLLAVIERAEARDIDPESALRALLARMRTRTPGPVAEGPGDPADGTVD